MPIYIYDIEKAFDSVEFPILLSHLCSLGINGKTWRLIKSWYSSPTSRVKHQNVFSAPFPINRGVKQGSVLSPSLFLIVMNSLLKKMRNSNKGGSLHGTFVGITVHADDVRSIAPNIQSVISQSSDILSFTTDLGLKLNTSKLELIQMSQTTSKPIEIAIADHILTTKSSASCLGVKRRSDLSARDSVNTNILKARKAFFGLGSTGVYHGKLNPLSSSSIFESFVLPVLLYGCETWMLDATCIQALEKFQSEIVRRILKLSKHHPSDAVQIALNWPTISTTRIPLRKLTFLSRLLTNSDDTMCSRIFTSLAIVDVYSISICYGLCEYIVAKLL